MVEIMIGAGESDETGSTATRKLLARRSRRPVVGQALEDRGIRLCLPAALQDDAAAGIEGDDIAQALRLVCCLLYTSRCV